MKEVKKCSECGGYGYYTHDYFGNEVGERIACLECFGWGFLSGSDDYSTTK